LHVSKVDKAFGATFVDIEDLKFIESLAYKKVYIHAYLKGELAKDITDEVQKEIAEIFEKILRISNDDVELKDRNVNEYKFLVLNPKNVKKAFNRINRAFKRKNKDK
jgi:hypothetical protein